MDELNDDDDDDVLYCIALQVDYMQSSIRDMKKIPTNDASVCLQIQDAFVRIKRQVAEHVLVWNDRIHDFEVQAKKSAADRTRSTSRPIHVTSSQSQLSADDESSDFSVISDSVVEDADVVGQRDEEARLSAPLPMATPPPPPAAGCISILNNYHFHESPN